MNESEAPERVKGLGNVMRRARRAAGLSREALSAKVGRSVGEIRAAERGHITVTERYYVKVLEVCGQDPATYDGGDGAVCVDHYGTVRPVKAAKPRE